MSLDFRKGWLIFTVPFGSMLNLKYS